MLVHLALRMGFKVFATEVNMGKVNKAVEMGAVSSMPHPTFELQTEHLTVLWHSNGVAAVFECAGSNITASLATAAAPRGSENCSSGTFRKASNLSAP